ncbi:15633_t:CDS:2, partial [Rhizophagus irregularis]
KSKELVHVTVTIRVNTNLSNLQELKLYCNNYDLRIFNYNMVFDRFKNSDDSECHEKSLRGVMFESGENKDEDTDIEKLILRREEEDKDDSNQSIIL